MSAATRRRGPSEASSIAIAIGVLLFIGIAVYLAFGGRTPWQRHWELKAMVRSSNELQSRSPVRIAGVNVGKVKKVESGPGGTAIVTMVIEEAGRPIHRDATLKIRPRLFLEGNFFVDLSPGTPTAPLMGRGETIPLANTSTPVQLDQVLSTLQRSTRDDLRRLLRALSKGFDEGGAEALRAGLPPAKGAFEGAAIVFEAVRGERDGDLAGAIRDGERVFRALATRRQQIPRLVADLDRTLGTLADRRARLSRSVVELDALLGEATPALRAIDRVVPDTRAIAVEALPGLRAAPATLNLARPLMREARGLVGPTELPALLDQLDPAIRSLASIEPQLVELLDRLRPVTECVRLNALPTLKKPVVDPPLTTGDPVYRELLHTLVGLSSGSQNFNGNGPAVRYLAGFGDQLVTTGRVPSAGEALVGLTSEPLLGSRPRYTGVLPPFRPDVPCASQRPPDLAAETGPAPAQRRIP